MEWAHEVADALVAGGVRAAAYVPDSRLDRVLRRLAAAGVALRSLTREEECVGYVAGQRVADARAAVLMQSSGLGNALNAIGSLAVPYRLGVPLVVTMRGTLGERNPSQVPMGRAAPALLGALGVQSFALRRPEDARAYTEGVLRLAFAARETAALLLEPELGGGRS